LNVPGYDVLEIINKTAKEEEANEPLEGNSNESCFLYANCCLLFTLNAMSCNSREYKIEDMSISRSLDNDFDSAHFADIIITFVTFSKYATFMKIYLDI